MLERMEVMFSSEDVVAATIRGYLLQVQPELADQSALSQYQQQIVQVHVDRLDWPTLLGYVFDMVANHSDSARRESLRHLMGIGLNEAQARDVEGCCYTYMHHVYTETLHPVISAFGPVLNITFGVRHSEDPGSTFVILSRESNNHAGYPLQEFREPTIALP